MGSKLSSPRTRSSREVVTKYGPVIGRRFSLDNGKEVDAFQGIPFAKPPIGEFRFEKPQPPDPWVEPKKTRKFTKRCWQKDIIFFDKWRKGPCSEDILYLNVFTPTWEAPPNGFPVMVFVHGGGFVMDGAMTYGDIGIAKHLVAKEVVVVTLQYRLGYLGFFTTGDEVCPGNLGLWDQTAGLQWVHDNIAVFGGNKENVTLIGQSAGGASVNLLALSPHSNELFKQFCPLAGNAYSKWLFHPEMQANCRKFAAKLGVYSTDSREIIKQLRRLPAKKFAVDVKISDNSCHDVIHGLKCTPVLDGDFLPQGISELCQKAPEKPMMIGVCRLEALIFLASLKPSLRGIESLVEAVVPEEIPDRAEKVNSMVALYVDENCRLELDNKSVFRAHAEAMSDVLFNSSTLQTVQQILRHRPNTPIFNFVFDYVNPKSWGLLSFTLPIKDMATHCTELAYLFEKGIIFDYKFNQADQQMLHIFSTAFTNFAKYGDPNGASSFSSDLPCRFEPTKPEAPERHYVFTLEPHMSDDYFEGRPQKYIELSGTSREELSCK